MKCHLKIFLFALLALAAAFFFNAATGSANTVFQEKKTADQAEEQEDPEYEEQYNAWESADKEPDLLKRGTLLIQFLGKYPKSRLLTYIDSSYGNLLLTCSNGQKYQELETLAEQWLKIHPNDLRTLAYIATASEKLGHNEKWLQSLTEIYKIQPTASLASDIAQTYDKLKNRTKNLEWTEAALKYPENETNYQLRLELVKTYTDAKDFAKATEYARAALSAADKVKEPSAETREQIRTVRHACYDVIGKIQFEQDKFAESIKSFELALKAKKYDEGYYYIALCLRKQDKIDDAMLYYARAELMRGEFAVKAKENLETLYKAIHNNTLIGIEKVYNKAKVEPAQ